MPTSRSSLNLFLGLFSLATYIMLAIKEEHVMVYWKLAVQNSTMQVSRTSASTEHRDASRGLSERGLRKASDSIADQSTKAGRDRLAEPDPKNGRNIGEIDTSNDKALADDEEVLAGSINIRLNDPKKAGFTDSVGLQLPVKDDQINESTATLDESRSDSESESESEEDGDDDDDDDDEAGAARNTQESRSKLSKDSQTNEPPPARQHLSEDIPRNLSKVAIYMTTSMSGLHRAFLRGCWPQALQGIPLVQEADLIVYTSDTERDKEISRLGFRNVVFRRFQEQNYTDLSQSLFRQKQDGAVRAMLDPFKEENQWFRGYEWIIRLNPDVLIRSDRWLLRSMMNKTVDAILGEWPGHPGMLLTDFNAFRPNAVNATALFEKYNKFGYGGVHAESHIYPGFSHLIESGRVAWIPNIEFPGMEARIGGGKCDVVHNHKFLRFCNDYANVTYLNATVTMVDNQYEFAS